MREIKKGPTSGDWYCNLLRFDRRKVLLFTGADTLFSFLVPGIKRADLIDFGTIFLSHLESNLRHEGFPEPVIREAVGVHGVLIGRTVSRSVLGSMKELALDSEYMLASNGGLQAVNILDVNKRLNRTLLSPLGSRFPIEALTERLAGKANVFPIRDE